MSAPSWVRGDGSAAEDLLRRAVSSLRGRQDALLLAADGPDRPDLVLVDRRVGLYAIEVEPHGYSAEDRAPFVRLNRKRAELRDALGDLAATGVGAAVVLGAVTGRSVSTAPGSLVLTGSDFDDPAWPDRLPARPLDEVAFRAVVEQLAPSVVFTRHGRTTTADPGSSSRTDARIQLDGAQAAAALAPVDDIAVVTGPPGSGKTLLLAARARHLAAHHPDWHVAVVMYNRALVPYVASLVGLPSVTVATAGRFAHSLGLRINFEGGEPAAEELARARSQGIPRTVDALLVDEAQDFDPAWLELLLDTVRPGRGGALIVGDAAQSLYREFDLNEVLCERNVVRHTLMRPYRSTRPILRVAGALTPTASLHGLEWAMDGEPVDLVWASSWDEQAACVAAEVHAMITDGLREPHDIAILVTKRAGTLRRLQNALNTRQVPYELVDRANADTFDPSAPTVKLLTVHSGKGHEFPVVVLFGLEALPVSVDDRTRQQERVGFVGATRAKDQLLITYTRANAHLERLIELGDDVRRWIWPDDYEES
ncbi:3'-5' exonuclease [Actinosynnema sp. NPDC059797]